MRWEKAVRLFERIANSHKGTIEREDDLITFTFIDGSSYVALGRKSRLVFSGRFGHRRWKRQNLLYVAWYNRREEDAANVSPCPAVRSTLRDMFEYICGR